MSGDISWVQPGADAVIINRHRPPQTVKIARVGKRYAIVDHGSHTQRFDMNRAWDGVLRESKGAGSWSWDQLYPPDHPRVREHEDEARKVAARRVANDAADTMRRDPTIENVEALIAATQAYVDVLREMS